MNNQKVIVWNTNWSLFEDAKCSQAILDVSDGIVIDARKESQEFYRWVKNHFDNEALFRFSEHSILLLNPYYEDMIRRFPEIKRFYLDEFYSNLKQHKNSIRTTEGILFLGQNGYKLIYGEIDKFLPLADNEEITYTAYQDLWFKICGLRIYVPFSNQIKTWDELEKKYVQKALIPQNIDIKMRISIICSQFNYCWIKLGQRNIKECIQWCNEHSKQICLYIPTDLSKERFLELINKFKGEL